jgi:hypothetical protein
MMIEEKVKNRLFLMLKEMMAFYASVLNIYIQSIMKYHHLREILNLGTTSRLYMFSLNRCNN